MNGDEILGALDASLKLDTAMLVANVKYERLIVSSEEQYPSAVDSSKSTYGGDGGTRMMTRPSSARYFSETSKSY